MNQRLQQTLALGGVAQAAYLTSQIARHGVASADSFAPCVESLFVMNPEKTEDVYGGVGRLRLGLEVIEEALNGSDSLMKSPDILRYMMGLLHLESRLRKNTTMISGIVNGLEDIARHYPAAENRTSTACIHRLAGLYQNTISTLRHRIQVQGDYQFLNDDYNAARIRALLLAGIRSAVLWRQVGGRRWQLLLQRGKIKQDVQILLNK